MEGSQAQFDCAIASLNSVSIAWRHNGSTVTPSGKFSYLANGSLSINPVESGDQGVYTCVVMDQVTSTIEERSASLAFACESISTLCGYIIIVE